MCALDEDHGFIVNRRTKPPHHNLLAQLDHFRPNVELCGEPGISDVLSLSFSHIFSWSKNGFKAYPHQTILQEEAKMIKDTLVWTETVFGECQSVSCSRTFWIAYISRDYGM